MNPATAIALVLTACCELFVVQASIVDQSHSYGPHAGGHWWGSHGPKYRKISLIGGGGGGLLHPAATASIASTASVSVPQLLHDHHRRPVLATYRSRSGPGVYGSHHAGGNHCRGATTAVHCKDRLLGKLLAKKSTGVGGYGGGCGWGKEAKIGCGGCHGRLRLVGPTCCGSCAGCGGVHC